MIFKIIGGLITVAACYILGCSKSSEFSDRVSYLSCLQSCVIKLENEIRYTQTPLLLSFHNISKTPNQIIKNLFLLVIDIAENCPGKTLSEIWTTAINNYSDKIHKGDIDLFLSFSECLGTFDLEGQLKSIRLFSVRIADALQEAIQLSNKNKKLYKSLGLYGGILLFLLFF